MAAEIDGAEMLTSKAAWFTLPARAAAVSYTHLRAHETVLDLVCRLLLEKKNKRLKTTLQCYKTTTAQQTTEQTIWSNETNRYATTH